jgi:hypothetical protein
VSEAEAAGEGEPEQRPRAARGPGGDHRPADWPLRIVIDNDYQRGEGMMEHTPSIHLAMHFSTTEEAWAFYRQQSRLHPTRPDGQPNRPLTAWHMMD